MRREDWDERYAAVENLWAAKPNRLLVSEVAELPPGRALDLACGEGQNAIWLGTLGWKVTGVDYSEVAIEKARARAEREGIEVEFVWSDVLEYELERAAFDLILLLYFHLPADELHLVLARAQAALAAGGTIVIIGHDWTNITDGVGGPRDPAILYAPEEIADELGELEIVRATQVLRDVPGEERDAIDAFVRARRPRA